jgi:NNP family nitrate/nitrite transporter-like MFS transporter
MSLPCSLLHTSSVRPDCSCARSRRLESKGINSRGTQDVFGRKFQLPVDAEHKSSIFGVGLAVANLPGSQPHMRAFWGATFGFFSCFFSVFAPAALMPYLRRPVAEGGIALTGAEIANSGAAGVGTTIVMRVITGPLCDMFGARKTFIFLLMLAVPGIIGMMFITNGAGLIACRAFIGLGLACFVTCQVWCSQMFSKSVVGFANATAGGWGNLGGGVTQLVMPFIMLAFLNATGQDVDRSWRLCFIVPLLLHVFSAMFILTGRDLPDGNYSELEKQGSKQKSKGGSVAKVGFSNVNAYLLLITYGLCFGVELTMNNKAVLYFYRYYGVSPQIAGVLGSCFGLMNLFARSWGGILSDSLNKKYGMRGRIWGMWVVQTLEGLMCIVMGLITVNLDGPDDFSGEFVTGAYTWTEGRTTNEYLFNATADLVPRCGSKQIVTPEMGLLDGVYAPLPTADAFIMILDPDKTCLHHTAPLGLTMFVMVLFSTFVQMAEGLHYGIVPYVSRPALGIVSGMVGAGGNLGAVIGSRNIVHAAQPLDNGFINLGIIIVVVSLVMHGLYFPESGGMLFKAGALGKYDPQLIKPAADLRGADQLNYANGNQKV